jgi:hypothetical protein
LLALSDPERFAAVLGNTETDRQEENGTAESEEEEEKDTLGSCSAMYMKHPRVASTHLP